MKLANLKILFKTFTGLTTSFPLLPWICKSRMGWCRFAICTYAVDQINNGQNIPTSQQSNRFTAFGKVKQLTEGIRTAEFDYNMDRKRVRMVMREYGNVFKTRYYFGGSCEREEVGSTTTQYIWIGGDAYTAEAVAKKVGTGDWTIYNIFRDNLGTITHLKDMVAGTVTEYSFDAWGRRRDANDWTTTLTNEPALFADRGFTGHEYLEDFKLYNMNGRLYDPVVGRFLNADPLVQDPGNTQSYNRYSYCMNNPLKYTDPSGYQWMNKRPWITYSFNGDSERSSFWASGSAPSNTPHIDRQLQEGIKQDAAGGWRWDETTGTYSNIFSGESGSTDEVYNNYILPNTLPLTAENLVRNRVRTISSQYVSYRTGANGAITGAQMSYTPTNVQLVFFEMGGKTYSTYIRSGNGISKAAASTDGGISGIRENNFVKNSIDGISVWAGTIQTSFDAAKVLQPTVSTWIKGAKVFGKTSNYLGGVSILYDFATGTANSSTIADGIVMVGGAATIFFGGVALAPWVAGAGVVYGMASVCGGEAWLNRNIDISKYMNFVKPSNHY